ncbi:MAG: DUF504 domain-containing protein [Candidatus Methanomethylicaceae archaeon]|nr:DUF504 domain-containing protein [Candidatus Verstraetearchaeota archaeon]
MKTIRDILNKIKWTSGLEGIEIIIIHRGAPNNEKIIKGEEIKDIAPRAIICENLIIPYHRVICIKKNGIEIWRKCKK